jgi:GntR family transcriptional regulator
MFNALIPPLNQSDHVPLYFQIKNVIAEQIREGKLASGELLPSEYALMQMFNVSRATIRQALGELEMEGLIERKQGVGTFVKSKKIEPEIIKLTSFSEDMRSRGLKPGSKTLEVENILPDAQIMNYLGLSAKVPVWCVRRLRFANDEPIGLQYLYIPPWLEVDPEELINLQSYYDLLSRKGIKLAHATELLIARNATKREAELLNIKTGRPLLVADRVTYDARNVCVEYVQFIYRADRYQYRLTLYA